MHEAGAENPILSNEDNQIYQLYVTRIPLTAALMLSHPPIHCL